MTLAEMKAGERGVITGLDPALPIRTRLLEMGLVTSTPVVVVRFAPFGDPIEIVVRGYHLSLRKDEASMISVSLVQGRP